MPLDILAEMNSEDLQEQEQGLELLLLIESPLVLHAFFEGDSDKYYYLPRIYEYTKQVKIIICGSKNTVKKYHTSVNKKTKKWTAYKFGFFIDRDFDAPYVPQKNVFPIFETPCYAVENFYVSPVAFEHILARKLYITAVEADYKIALDTYIKLQKDFHLAVLSLNAYCACIRDIEHNTNQARIKLPEPKFINKIISFYWLDISENPDYDAQIATFFTKNDIPIIQISADALAAKKAYFATKQPSQDFRGKYELHFLTKYLSLLLINSQNTTLFTKKIQVSFNINAETIMQMFSDCADTPATLTAYLATVC